MNKQQLIYQTAVPVSAGRHGKVSVEAGRDHGFCRDLNSVPLMAVEFAAASAEYVVVFAENADQVMPVVVLGARAQQNLYVDEQGHWQAKYLPAFVRRYPFVFSADEEGKTFTLCVDEACPGVNYLGRGEALFTPEGQPTPYVNNVMQFLQEYRVQFNRTQAFGARLKALGLLMPMQAQFKLDGGEQRSLTGFLAVDRERLKALAPEHLAELAANDALELVYLHLSSMRHFAALKDKLALSAVTSEQAPAVPEATAAAEPAAAAP